MDQPTWKLNIILFLGLSALIIMTSLVIQSYVLKNQNTITGVQSQIAALEEHITALQAQLKAHDDRYPWFDQKGDPVATPGGE